MQQNQLKIKGATSRCFMLAGVITVLTLIIFLSGTSKAHADNDIKDAIDLVGPQEAYDFVLPMLMEMTFLPRSALLSTRLQRAVSLVNFFSTPGFSERHSCLGTPPARMYQNASICLASGNMACSEQASLIAQMLLDEMTVGVTDIPGHTFHEYEISPGIWSIADPYYDVRFKNNKGNIISFEEAVETSIKHGQLQKRERNYFSKFNFNKTAFYAQGFRKRKQYKKESPDSLINLALPILLETVPSDPTERQLILLTYIRNNLRHMIINEHLTPAQIQDYLLQKIPPQSELFHARQLQLLNRTDLAARLLSKHLDHEEAALFLAQIYFMKGDRQNFKKLATRLDKNTYYQTMEAQWSGNVPDDLREFEHRNPFLSRSEALDFTSLDTWSKTSNSTTIQGSSPKR